MEVSRTHKLALASINTDYLLLYTAYTVAYMLTYMLYDKSAVVTMW